jgi:hypothetical protein
LKKIKRCEKHNLEKKEIGKNKQLRCNECFNEYRRNYNLKNIEKVKEKNKKYNALTKQRREEWTRQDRKENPERHKEYGRRYYHLNFIQYQANRTARKYGLSYDDYIEMIKLSNDKCAICNQEEKRRLGKQEKLTQLSIDHNHKNGKVRGLICYGCNLIIGYAEDNIQLLKNAISYLEKHKHFMDDSIGVIQ